MPRIKLAYWHGDHNPGDEVDVTDEELRQLTVDGRVAEVLDAPAAVEPEQAQPEPAPAETGRKQR
ncbi:hypothetical protein GCM10010099_21080 [Streptomyces cinereus]|nr:hypothetical protein GCM10010099_21080 [Streptomyces cinereus]